MGWPRRCGVCLRRTAECHRLHPRHHAHRHRPGAGRLVRHRCWRCRCCLPGGAGGGGPGVFLALIVVVALVVGGGLPDDALGAGLPGHGQRGPGRASRAGSELASQRPTTCGASSSSSLFGAHRDRARGRVGLATRWPSSWSWRAGDRSGPGRARGSRASPWPWATVLAGAAGAGADGRALLRPASRRDGPPMEQPAPERLGARRRRAAPSRRRRVPRAHARPVRCRWARWAPVSGASSWSSKSCLVPLAVAVWPAPACSHERPRSRTNSSSPAPAATRASQRGDLGAWPVQPAPRGSVERASVPVNTSDQTTGHEQAEDEARRQRGVRGAGLVGVGHRARA